LGAGTEGEEAEEAEEVDEVEDGEGEGDLEEVDGLSDARGALEGLDFGLPARSRLAACGRSGSIPSEGSGRVRPAAWPGVGGGADGWANGSTLRRLRRLRGMRSRRGEMKYLRGFMVISWWIEVRGWGSKEGESGGGARAGALKT